MISLPVWYENLPESSVFLHALKCVLWVMANANSSGYIDVWGMWGRGGDTKKNVGVQFEIYCFNLFFMKVYSNCK